MSEMIERVAKAMYDMDRGAAEARWEKTNQEFRNYRMKKARAAITAMREPSPVMMDAGRPWALNDKSPPNCWIKMIEAALK